MKDTVNFLLITYDFIVKAEVHVSPKLKVISKQVASSFVLEKASSPFIRLYVISWGDAAVLTRLMFHVTQPNSCFFYVTTFL